MLDGHANTSAKVDFARQNLAATFVSAFLNAGFGEVPMNLIFKIMLWVANLLYCFYFPSFSIIVVQAKLITLKSDVPWSGSFENWLFQHEEHGRTSAVACLVYIFLTESSLLVYGSYKFHL